MVNQNGNGNGKLTKTGAASLRTTVDNPYIAYSQALGEDAFLKFVKGEFLFGPEEESLPPGTRLVCGFPEFYAGYTRWENGEATEERLVRVCDGPPPRRDDLGDLDEAQWEIDEDTGKRRDPWQWTNRLLLRDMESGRQFVFVTGSKGGVRALGKLAGAYGREMATRPGQLPIVEIGADSYKHKTYGKVWFPVFLIVDWINADGSTASDPTPPTATEGLSDEIPY